MVDGMWRVSIVTLILALVAGISIPVSASVRSEMARESAEYIMRKFGKEVGKDTVETLAEKLANIGLRHGDEAIVALRKIGPRGLQIIADAGEHAADVVRLMTQFGEEAAWVLSRPRGLAIFLRHGDDGVQILIKHHAVAEPLVERFGEAAVHAFSPLTPQNGRRLAMLADEGAVMQGSRASEVLDVVAKGGDKAMEFIWHNKGALAVTAGLTAFLAHPQIFIDGTKDLAEIVSRPATQVAKELGREIGRRTNWTVVIIAAIGLGTAYLGGQRWLKNRTRLHAALPVAQKAIHS